MKMPKMHWDCDKSGCFNINRRPKIEVFDDCFPGAIAFGDVDAAVEIDGRLMLLEWKGDGGSIKGGQDIMYCRITRDFDVAVCVIHGDAKTMEVEKFYFYLDGKKTPVRQGGLMDVKRQLRVWVKKTRKTELPIDANLNWISDYDKAAG